MLGFIRLLAGHHIGGGQYYVIGMAPFRPPWLPPSSEATTAESVSSSTVAPTGESPPTDSTVLESNESGAGAKQDPLTGKFLKGHGGRPKGSRNRVTLAIENMLEGEGERIARVAIERALAGDPVALKLVLDRIAPVRKGRSLPTIDVKDGEGKIEALLRAVLDGELTPDEGQSVIGLIESAARIQVAHALEDQRRAQLDALKKAQESGAVQGGVMLVPVLDLQNWDAQAQTDQQQLKSRVRE
jgi:hypothetical protein